MQLEIDRDKCTGCRICMIYCSFDHEGVIWPDRSRIRIEAETDSGPFSPQICRQCNARRAAEGAMAPCAEACPVNAIRLEERAGNTKGAKAWIVHLDACTGCGACEEACPFGMIIFDREREVALKCDLCGGDPACAAMCPSGAIRVRMA